MNSLEISLLRPDHFREIWPQLQGGLAASRMLDFWTADGLFEAGVRGKVQVWGLAENEIELVLFTDIITYGTGIKALRFIGGFGAKYEQYEPLLIETFSKVCKNLECQKVEVLGREGWGRRLKRLGFKHSYSVFYRWVDEGRKETVQ